MKTPHSSVFAAISFGTRHEAGASRVGDAEDAPVASEEVTAIEAESADDDEDEEDEEDDEEEVNDTRHQLRKSVRFIW
jgi:TATA-binding protein-associated factor Taf7